MDEYVWQVMLCAYSSTFRQQKPITKNEISISFSLNSNSNLIKLYGYCNCLRPNNRIVSSFIWCSQEKKRNREQKEKRCLTVTSVAKTSTKPNRQTDKSKLIGNVRRCTKPNREQSARFAIYMRWNLCALISPTELWKPKLNICVNPLPKMFGMVGFVFHFVFGSDVIMLFEKLINSSFIFCSFFSFIFFFNYSTNSK